MTKLRNGMEAKSNSRASHLKSVNSTDIVSGLDTVSKKSSWPCYSLEEADAVQKVLLSNKVNYWTGTEGRQFEKEFAHYADCEHGIAMANGSVVIEAALRALKVGAGDEVIVTSRTFIASISSIVNVGATPVFADVDLDSQNITADSILPVMSKKTKAIICVHLAGWPCEMDAILELAGEYNIYVIEDCAQAHGATYKSKSVGSMGDIGCWSFCQDKIMTTGGEGGMVTTNNYQLWSDMWSLKDHGKSYEKTVAKNTGTGFKWLHDSFGSNWRLTEMQSAIGRIQLKRLDSWSDRRRFFASNIWNCASQLPGLRVPKVPDYIQHAAYRCYVFVESDQLKQSWSRDRIVEELVLRNVSVMSGSCSEVYLEKAFDTNKLRPEKRLPNAKRLGETSLMFLIQPNMHAEELDNICRALESVMAQAAKKA